MHRIAFCGITHAGCRFDSATSRTKTELGSYRMFDANGVCAQASHRDTLGRHLGQTAATKLRHRAASARRAAPPLTPGAMPPPKSGLRPPGSSNASKPPARPLSEAGRKLARSLAGATPGSAADAQLRASYRGATTPKQAGNGGATPGGSFERTPSATPARTPLHGLRKAALAAVASHVSGSSSAGSGGGGITDDLLDI